MVRFYIVRHGQTLLNSLDRAQGWADSPLTEAGMQMAADIGQKLKGIDFGVVFTSDMLRAVQTAENNAVFIKNVSDWLGGVSSFAELNQRLPDVADVIYEHDTTGMAEPFQTIEERLKATFVDIVQRHGMEENTNILIVTHAFAIKTIFHLFAPKQLGKVGKVKNSSVSRLVFENEIFFLEPYIQL